MGLPIDIVWEAIERGMVRRPIEGYTTLNVDTQVLDGSVKAAVEKVGSELFTIVHKPGNFGEGSIR